MRRGTPSDCQTDSNTSTTGGSNQLQSQQQNNQLTHVSFGDDEDSCDSHTRWGKKNYYSWAFLDCIDNNFFFF